MRSQWTFVLFAADIRISMAGTTTGQSFRKHDSWGFGVARHHEPNRFRCRRQQQKRPREAAE